MLYSIEEIDKDHDLYEPAVALRQTGLFPVGRVTRSYIQDEHEDNGTLLVAQKNNKLLGCGRVNVKGDSARLSHMVVGEEHRFNGVGTSILTGLLDKAKEQGANKVVLASSPAAIPFYQRFGFKPSGEEESIGLLDITAQKLELDLE